MSKDGKRIDNNRPRGPMGRGRVIEKPKDFKGSIIRITKELGAYKRTVIIALCLAAIASLISVSAPKRLSKLTDEVRNGLVPNTTNLELVGKKIQDSFSQANIQRVLNSDLSLEDKDSIISFSTSMNYSLLTPNAINALFKDIDVDGVTISVNDQIKALGVMSKMNGEDKDNYVSYLKELPDSVIKVIEPKMDMDKIKGIVIFLVCLYLTSALLNYTQDRMFVVVSNKFARRLRNDVSVKINKLPLKYFDNHINGDLLSRITNDIDLVANTLNDSLATLVSAGALLLGSVFMMFYTNWVMALTAVGSSIIGFSFMFLLLGRSQKYFMRRQTELGNLNGHIEEIYSGLNVVKAYNGEDDALKEFDVYNRNVFNANFMSQFLSGLMQPLMGFIGNLGYVCVCIVGALLTMKGTITFGVIIAFITYVRLFSNPLNQIAQAAARLQSTAAASERIFELFDEKEMANEKHFDKYLDKDSVKGNIEFKNVEFTYDGNNKPTIKGFSAKAKAGQKIAIVGPTGAGKTTLVNLLMKFYDITDGDILIDGVSIKELKRENIHDLFTMVLQDTWLFDGTVKENIVYNRENVSFSRIKEVCKTVGIDHFIKTLSKGYDSNISDGDSVSSGQRQLLTIARGMIEDSPFLILDEATSNVDTRTEELVQKAMDEISKGKTSFIIAHRLSTIKNADLILVMNEGNIIEQGTHEELLKLNGFYANLYNSQFSNN